MNKTLVCIATSCMALPMLSHAQSPYFSLKDGDGFKRFSVSVGALHVMPQGKAQPFQVDTIVDEGTKAKVGDVLGSSVVDAIDTSVSGASTKKSLLSSLLKGEEAILDTGITQQGLISFKGSDGKQYLKSSIAGEAELDGLSTWNNPGTGLEADSVTTLGIMTNYFFTDNISLEMKAGIPPKVDLKGTGKIYAPLSGIATPGSIGSILGDLPLKKDIEITDLSAHGTAATARAWTPAAELQYHFGKTGVNKFRPYVGVGVMYAYFNELEMNPQIKQDLVNAGHMIANIKDGKAGAALDGKTSSANPQVDLEASSAFAPVATVGFTYDFNDKWFAVGSVSYAHLKGDTTITVSDATKGELIRSKADIDINPILAYAGVGIRF